MSDVIAGRIELLEPLARGASGSLWRAIDRRYGAVCAAKVMRQRDGADVLRFVREQTVGTAQGLGQHPHLLPPYTWVAEDDTVVLVMPLVHGGTLAGAIADHGALSASLVAELLRQLLDALAAMHHAHWVHRDVKPANLLLDATGDAAPHLLLADFGIALHETDVRLTETGFVHGTPGFMAPELLEGAGTSFAQDVWAAGACALEALDPLPPRERPAPELLAPRATRALAGSSDPAAPALESLLLSLLSLDPEQRPAAAEARDALPAQTADPAQWSFTAAGERFEVFDQVPSVDARPEVPLDGPATLAGLAPGLHERLSALSSGMSAPSPAPGTPAHTTPAPPAPDTGEATVPRQGTTERFVHEPTRRVPPSPGRGAERGTASPVVTSAPSPSLPSPAPPSGVAPAPGATSSVSSGAWVGVLLLVLSLLCLLGAGTLLWMALA